MFLRKWVFLCLFFIPIFLSSNQIQLHGRQLSPALMQTLVNTFGLEILVETGTWGGTTAANGSNIFREVYTVELSHNLFQQGYAYLLPYHNVHPFEDHSPEFLKKIIPQLGGRTLFWLDAHWCGEGTAYASKNTPIVDELAAIRDSGLKDAVILIDDIRCFHNLDKDILGYGGYPTLQEIKRLILEINPLNEFWVLGDMVIAFPKEDNIIPSPLVYACTLSRLFDPINPNDAEVLEAERLLLENCKSIEAEEINHLQCMVIDSTKFIAFHLILWEGLLQLGRGNFEKAARCFEDVLANGYTHWRIYKYLAEAVEGQERTN